MSHDEIVYGIQHGARRADRHPPGAALDRSRGLHDEDRAHLRNRVPRMVASDYGKVGVRHDSVCLLSVLDDEWSRQAAAAGDWA